MSILNQHHLDDFKRDGFVVVRGLIGQDQVAAARARFEPLFRGEFETGLQPDEWNWREGRDSTDLTRQICNGWKADRTIGAIVLKREIGEAAARLYGWPGARLNQDNVLWKPPGAKALGFHQDESYQNWITPAQMMSCWLTLDDTKAHQGTIEYVRGSHKWPLSAPIAQFHGPGDPLAELRQAARQAGEEPEIVPIEISAGDCVFHHGRTWHGSRENSGTRPRRALVSHCMSSQARFDETAVGAIYGRYKRHGTTEMDESFFPVLWREDGYRTNWLTSQLAN